MTPDDLETGQLVMISEKPMAPSECEMYITSTRRQISYKSLFRIIAVNLPIVAVAVEWPQKGIRFFVDAREVDFAKVEESFLVALLAQEGAAGGGI